MIEPTLDLLHVNIVANVLAPKRILPAVEFTLVFLVLSPALDVFTTGVNFASLQVREHQYMRGARRGVCTFLRQRPKEQMPSC